MRRRKCKCGCGASLDGLKRNAKYACSSCRVRMLRRREARRDQAQSKKIATLRAKLREAVNGN